jgi:hypothetical protein
MEAANVYVPSEEFPWVSWLLLNVDPELFHDCKADYRASKERKQVHLE